jgi:hypothetical protein
VPLYLFSALHGRQKPLDGGRSPPPYNKPFAWHYFFLMVLNYYSAHFLRLEAKVSSRREKKAAG